MIVIEGGGEPSGPLGLTCDGDPDDKPSSVARVALVNMPFGMADRPSIQCGLLKTAVMRYGHTVDVHYLNLEFAAEFGASFYKQLSYLRGNLLVGEWLFSVAAFGYRPNEEEYRKARPAVNGFCKEVGLDFASVCQYRNETLPAWIQRWARAVNWSEYQVVGFTSTFEQNTASFALAKAIKVHHANVITVFGGANFDGDMGKEYVRALPFIDYAVVGEGDHAFPKLVNSLVAGKSPIGVAGVIGRSEGKVVGNYPAIAVRDMDDVDDPNYDDFFETLFRLGIDKVLADQQAPLLLIETGRGCWWGQKSHCTFCGLNANGITFRSKSPTRALALLRRMAGRYKIINFEAVDNILDYRYIEDLCGQLMREHFDYRLFYEVKANLKRDQLRMMAAAGIRGIQPGIESLSTHVLSLMRKGISMLHNVRCLMWAHYYGMRLSWNILTGFPGETEADYAEQVRIIPLLKHLPPPGGCGRIWMERFSPYFVDKSYPIANIRPLEAYRFIYPEDQLSITDIAYFFDYEMGATVPEKRHDELHRVVEEWKGAWKNGPRPELIYQRAPDWIQVIDRRTDTVAAHSFDSLGASIYEACSETDRTEGQLCADLEASGDLAVDAGAVHSALREFCDLGLMLEEHGRFLSLALPANANW